MPANFEIIVGTYEQFLLGYKIDRNDEYKLEQSFATHCHVSSVRTVSARKHYLASGGADDNICLFDMRYRRETGRLMHHNGTVNCLTFTPDASHLLTCSSDGSIGIVRCGNWQLEKLWQTPHKGSTVNVLAVHPSGKLALSAGGDGTLKTWNLVKGRQAYVTNLVPRLKQDAKYVGILKWSPSGEKYLLVANNRVDIYSVESAGIVNELVYESKVVCAEFLDDETVALGHEDGGIRIQDLRASDREPALESQAHDVRVKCLAVEGRYLVSASSSGEVKLWKLKRNKSLLFLSKVNCGARISCLCLIPPCPDLRVKKEEEEGEGEERENEETEADKRKKRMRLRQEVVVEVEDDNWMVEDVDEAKKAKKADKAKNAEKVKKVSKKRKKKV